VKQIGIYRVHVTQVRNFVKNKFARFLRKIHTVIHSGGPELLIITNCIVGFIKMKNSLLP